eukprot:scaffold8273_cov72-Skeletonema_dohrnii-CCMP3373.AAC.2
MVRLTWSKFWLGLMAENCLTGRQPDFSLKQWDFGEYIPRVEAAIHFANGINKDERERFDRVSVQHILAQHSKYLA